MSKLKITCVFALAAIEHFKANEGLEEVYVTSDGQGFSEDNKEKAEDRTRYLKDKEIKYFKRGFEEDYEEEDVQDDDPNPEAEKRIKAIEDYTEVFGKAPHHALGTEKIIKAVEDKKADLLKDKKPDTGSLPFTEQTANDKKDSETEKDQETGSESQPTHIVAAEDKKEGEQ